MKLDSKFLVGALTALSLFAPACSGDAKKEEPKKEEAKPETKDEAKPETKDEAKPEEKKDEAPPADGEKKDEAAAPAE